MENQSKLENVEVLQFDFNDSELVVKAINLLNSSSNYKKHDQKFWQWRFDKNPFADNYGWYATDKKSGELAAILLYWPWKFYHNNQEYLFYQAINGITNKKYRNRGIFLALNNKAIEFFSHMKCPLFGIPNGQSYPTYKKIGWQTVEKIEPFYIPLSPLNSALRYLTGGEIKPCVIPDQFLLQPFECKKAVPGKIGTIWTKELMDWRFVMHPQFNYYIYHKDGGSIVFKIKERGKITEAQIVLSCGIIRNCFKQFKKFLVKHNVDLLSYYGKNTDLEKIINRTVIKFRRKRALYLVLKDIPELSGIPFMLELAERDTT